MPILPCSKSLTCNTTLRGAGRGVIEGEEAIWETDDETLATGGTLGVEDTEKVAVDVSAKGTGETEIPIVTELLEVSEL